MSRHTLIFVMWVLRRRGPCAQRWPWPFCAEAMKPAGLTSPPLLFPDTSEQRRLRERGRKDSCLPSTSLFPDSCGYLSPLCPSHPPIPPSFLTLACLFAGIPALCLCFLSPSLSPSFSFSPTLRGGQEVEEGRDGEKVRWLG